MRAPQRRIGRHHHEEICAGLHDCQELLHEWCIMLHVLQDIEKKYSIGTPHVFSNILGRTPEEKRAMGETRAGKGNGVGVRIDANACVLPMEGGSVPPRSAPHIHNGALLTRGEELVEECADNLPSTGEPPVRLLESGVCLKLWELHATSLLVPRILHL